MYIPVALLALGACDPLEPIEDEGCGNQVINEDEDCDGDSPFHPDATCGERNTANACFFVCSDPDTERCPDGWGCGADGRCRRPSGAFEFRNGPRLALENFTVDDVDGDGALDLVGSVGPSVSVRFGDGGGGFEDGIDQSLPMPTGAISFGRLAGDARMDMLVPVELGFFSLLGTQERTLEPFNYAPFTLPFPADSSRVLVIEAYNPTPALNASEAVFLLDSAMAVISFDDPSAMPTPAPLDAGTLAERLPRYDLDGDSLTELVLLHEGHDRAYFYESSGERPLRMLGVPATDMPGQGNELLMPLGHYLDASGGLFADVDMDGDVDLVVAVRRTLDGAPCVAVAYQDDNGVFDARARIEPLFGDRGVDRPWPLAAADFNGDMLMDYVLSDGIALAVDDPILPDGVADFLVIFNEPIGDTEWDHAAILDINHDGQPDVAVAGAEGSGVDIFLNTSLAGEIIFNPFHVSTDRPIQTLSVGDYDGDLLADLVFIEDGSPREPDRLSVVFGAVAGGPTARVDMGAVGVLESLDTGSLLFGLNGLDVASDIVFLARPFVPPGQPPAPLSAAIMFGDASRKLISPFLLTNIPLYYPAATVLGRFGHPAVVLGPDAPDALVVVAHELALWPAFLALTAGVGGQGNLYWQQNYVARLPPLEQFNSSCALYTAGALRPDSDDALVGIDLGPDCGAGASPPRLLLAEDIARPLLPDGPPPMFPTDAEYLMFLENAPELPASVAELSFATTEVRRMELVDMDGDGARDLLLVSSGADDIGRILILWNSDVCGGDRLCPAARTELVITDVPSPDFQLVLDAAPILLETGARPELAVLTDRGVLVLALEGDARQYGAARWVLQVPQNETAEDGRLRVADIDADGLEDVVINTDGRVRIGLQQPHVPLGLEYSETRTFPEEQP